jgi:osmoprotectant transport system ATP-binding protein
MSWLACVDEDGMFKGYVTLRGVRSQLAETYRDA